MDPFNGQNKMDLSPFDHRGATYYCDDTETIWTENGEVLGCICSRGAQFGWLVFSTKLMADGDFETLRTGGGTWTEKDVEHDPAMDGLIAGNLGQANL